MSLLKIVKNVNVFAPNSLGYKDLLIAGEKIVSIEKTINIPHVDIIDGQGKYATPGFIDQHIHITGAGGKHGFISMTPEVALSELIACGTTTVVGLLGTDGSARSLKTLYAKAKALDAEGITAYMHTSYFGIPPITLTGTIQDDIIFIDKVLGCKIAISDERSSFPSQKELLRYLREVRVGGLISGKGGILHIHLGLQESKIELLLDIVNKKLFPIAHLSPTHVGKTQDLFDQAIVFSKKGGMIDISTGGTQYEEPYKTVLYGLEKGASIDTMTFSSDGNAGLGKTDKDGHIIGFKKAPLDLNLQQVQKLIQTKEVSISDALKLVTLNPAKNLSLKHKGHLILGADADICLFDDAFNLVDVISKGELMMKETKIIKKGAFE